MNPEKQVSPKVTAAVAAGALTVILAWVAGLWGLDVPPEVAAAVTTLLVGAAGYVKRDPKRGDSPPDPRICAPDM